MRQIWGGLLCLATGLVLALSGFGSGGDAAAGVTLCGPVVVGTPTQCPTGTISVTETSVGSATPPAAWTVTVDSSNCPILDPTITVPSGGTGTSAALFVFRDAASTTPCSYTLTETAVTGWTPAFDPAGPYSLAGASRGSGDITVALTNTSATVTTAPPTATTSPTTVTSAPRSTVVATTPRATASQLAATGPSTPVRWSLWVGVALCVAGAALAASGWRRRGTHTG